MTPETTTAERASTIAASIKLRPRCFVFWKLFIFDRKEIY
ncbi:hypothetical protein AD37_2240 [Escherichia coli 1-110-08_S4_C3]|nr:hypothetical protein AD37_2240 [Escherichia coli 1-110-08_S4_C3]EYE08040.1 hypothetical protein AD08_5398 [Escherichia coli 1-110-08_S4_C2]EZJ32624.1 hypothetical protein AD38_5201 [Escherichia coli 1-176-05_S4_C3]EZJ74977.1 hypothetical protein AC81_0301 [Escherichia coli 1-176-05_S4_C1]KDT58156.1 hypothetical protein AC05_4738 [Escherichia coli 3-267-03_S3_C1]